MLPIAKIFKFRFSRQLEIYVELEGLYQSVAKSGQVKAPDVTESLYEDETTGRIPTLMEELSKYTNYSFKYCVRI